MAPVDKKPGSQLNITMRPKQLDEIIGLETAVKVLQAKLGGGDVPRAISLTGPFGCGKTTLAYIIARMVQPWDFQGQPQIEEVNAGNVTGIDAMRTLADSAGSYPMVGKYKVIILDECHKLSKAAQELLLKEFEVVNSRTLWILCTTDPEKVTEGLIKGGRTFNVPVEGLNEVQRAELIRRACAEVGHEGEVNDLLLALKKGQVVSPRRILSAFESYHAGMPAQQAVGQVTAADMPEYHDIAFSLCYGQWDKDVTWAGGTVTLVAAGVLIKQLDDKLKKKSKNDEAEESETGIEAEDVLTKAEAAKGLRAVTAAFLKGMLLPKQKGKQYVFKTQEKMTKVYEAMLALASLPPYGAFEVEWPATIAALYRVNQKLNGR